MPLKWCLFSWFPFKQNQKGQIQKKHSPNCEQRFGSPALPGGTKWVTSAMCTPTSGQARGGGGGCKGLHKPERRGLKRRALLWKLARNAPSRGRQAAEACKKGNRCHLHGEIHTCVKYPGKMRIVGKIVSSVALHFVGAPLLSPPNACKSKVETCYLPFKALFLSSKCVGANT